MSTFVDFPLDPLVLDALRQMEYVTPTPVQAEAIPIVLEGNDLLALAETGSGKTAACAIPLCSQVDLGVNHIQTLIIVPTRELALQYATETQKIGRFKKVKVFALFGGEDGDLQRAKLKDGVHMLIATPGRLIDFIYARHIDLTHVTTLALDEADEMLGLGFLEDLEFIMNCLIKEHQTLLFSATMPEEIQEISEKYMKHPKKLSLNIEQATPKNLTHQFYFCRSFENKIRDLNTLLTTLDIGQSIIFVNSRKEAEEIYYKLKQRFKEIDFLHGGLTQDIRTIVTNKFARGRIRYLIATDIASRGLDFSGVTHVINYHLPRDDETYTHRAGRTARGGRAGACTSLVTKRDLGRVKRLVENPIWLNAKDEKKE